MFIKLPQENKQGHIIINSDAVIAIDPAESIRKEEQLDRCWVYLSNGKSYLITESAVAVQEKLNAAGEEAPRALLLQLEALTKAVELK